jgi:hypothetical protein
MGKANRAVIIEESTSMIGKAGPVSVLRSMCDNLTSGLGDISKLYSMAGFVREFYEIR